VELVKSPTNANIQSILTISPTKIPTSTSSIYSPFRIFPQIWLSTTPPPPQFEQVQILPAEMGTTPIGPMTNLEEIDTNKGKIKNGIMKRIGTTKIELKFGNEKRRKMNGGRHFGHSKMLKNVSGNGN
jgi:hypothetical protein